MQIVSRPAHSAQLVISGQNVRIENCPICVVDLHRDVEVGFQHIGKSLGYKSNRIAGIVIEGNFREAFSVGIACFCKCFLCSFHISFVREAKVAAVIGIVHTVYHIARGNEAVGRICIRLENIVDERIAVDSKVECLTNQHIVERGNRAVEIPVGCAVGWCHDKAVIVCLQAGIVGCRDNVHTVNLAGFISHQCCGVIRDVAEGDLIQLNLICIIVVGVLGEGYALTKLHIRHIERTVGNIGCRRRRPLVAIGFNCGLLNRIKGPHGKDICEEGSGVVEGDFQSSVIQSLNADSVKIIRFTGIVFCGACNVGCNEINVLSTGCRRENTLDGVDIVCRRMVTAVRPLQAVTQGEGVNKAVVTDGVALRFTADQASGLGVVGHQAFKSIGKNV